MYASVVLNIPLEKTFHYRIPEHLKEITKKFVRVKVNFGNSIKLGVIIDIVDEFVTEYTVKDIIEVYDEYPVLTDKELHIAQWSKERYFSSLGESLFLFIPKGLHELKKTPKPLQDEITKILWNNLNKEQQAIYDTVKKSYDLPVLPAFLLHGVTGSGKTEIYFRIMDDIIKKGKQIILLLPEIALTPQMQEFFTKRLDGEIAIIHSKVTQTKRLTLFRKILKNEIKIIIGARSALFAPTFNLGGIIIDEEHDDSYKSGQKPRYDTRFLALKKAKEYNALLLMGSATPSIETYYAAKQGELQLLELKSRYNNVPLPHIEIKDLRTEEKSSHYYLSKDLLDKIREVTSIKKKVILYLNRRGFHNFIQCKACGQTVYCPNCSIPFSFHKKEQKLRCHYCNSIEEPYTLCPYCGSKEIQFRGIGTEQIEEIITKELSEYKIGRFDADTVKDAGYATILENFRNGSLDILIGTQMIAKGHHFPEVELVGVINADILLNIPDFRANEKTFQSLVQVAGRAGRADKQGNVIVQTLRPEHYAIKCVIQQDYNLFITEELKIRKELDYPPFVRILRIVIRSVSKEKAEATAVKIGLFVKKIIMMQKDKVAKTDTENSVSGKISVIGPSPAPLEKIEANYRFHLICKSKQVKYLITLGNLVLREFPNKNNVYLELDCDPISLL